MICEIVVFILKIHFPVVDIYFQDYGARQVVNLNKDNVLFAEEHVDLNHVLADQANPNLSISKATFRFTGLTISLTVIQRKEERK